MILAHLAGELADRGLVLLRFDGEEEDVAFTDEVDVVVGGGDVEALFEECAARRVAVGGDDAVFEQDAVAEYAVDDAFGGVAGTDDADFVLRGQGRLLPLIERAAMVVATDRAANCTVALVRGGDARRCWR